MKLSHGFRSRFELEFAQHLAKNKIKCEYEKYKFRYIVPIKNYTPDSKTTYAHWCNRHEFLYADNRIPKEWLE